jgi:hypothetical protein
MVSPRVGAAIARRRVGGGAIGALRRNGQYPNRLVRLAGLARIDSGADGQVEAGADGQILRAEDGERFVRPD